VHRSDYELMWKNAGEATSDSITWLMRTAGLIRLHTHTQNMQ